MNVLFNNLKPQWDKIKNKTLKEINDLFENSDFINGEKVKSFEDDFSKWNKSKYSVGVSNGTDGLEIAARVLNLNKKIAIYIPTNTFIATFTAMYKAYPKADYFLVDCDSTFLMDVDQLSSLINSNYNNYDHSLVVPVHLYGAAVDMHKLLNLKDKYKFYIIEDCSQAHGSITNTNSMVGNDGDLGVFSLYPGKNLGAAGDAGIVVTNNKRYFKLLLSYRNLGMTKKYHHDFFSGNHRLDTIQAIILSNKLNYFDKWTRMRIDIASKYNRLINNPKVLKPELPNYCIKHVYHIYCVRVKNRNKFIDYLTLHNIPFIIHYPIPLHKSLALKNIKFKYVGDNNTIKFSNEILSLPLHPFITDDEVNFVSNIINKYK